MVYYRDEPHGADLMWAAECASIERFCQGRGLDVGAGGRTLDRRTLRLELFADHRPDVVGRAEALPFADGSLDYVHSCHTLEHLADPVAVLREWLRVVRPGGFVTSVIPDTRFTCGQNTDRTPHLHEWAPREFARMVFGNNEATRNFYGAKVVHFGAACEGWSFSFALEKPA